MTPLLNAVKTDAGVVLNGFVMSPCVEQCKGCERVREFDSREFCSSYADPAYKWRGGRCNFATHVKTQAAAKAKINPIKASKRASKGR